VSIHLSVVIPVYNERYFVATSIDRVLAVSSPLISKIDIIIVDDGSTDGTRELLAKIAQKHPEQITYIEHAFNQGKGAAVRTGIAHARGDVTIIHDADLEYDPEDFASMMVPFEREDADAVYGSRFLTRSYRRVLYYRHALGNSLITHLCNMICDLNLTDMETCYKAVRTKLLQSIPLVSNDFRIEPELTIKLAKREARVFEIPINYAGRTYDEGKKIAFKDALLAVLAMLRFAFSDDIFREDEGGAGPLVALSNMSKFNRWMADAIRPYLGARVLEIGSGIGNVTKMLVPRDQYTVSDVNPEYLDYLRSFAAAKPYIEVAKIDATNPDDFYEHLGAYDTVVCLNVLEHLEDDAGALRNLSSGLDEGGRVIVLVPQGPKMFGTLDELVGHHRRYTKAGLRDLFEDCGLELDALFDFNKATLPGWWLNGKLLKRKSFSKLQLRMLSKVTFLMRALDPVLPWYGTSLIAVGRRPGATESSPMPPVLHD
jgi:glycosyltransferase involved in cell wall biosynthesis